MILIGGLGVVAEYSGCFAGKLWCFDWVSWILYFDYGVLCGVGGFLLVWACIVFNEGCAET